MTCIIILSCILAVCTAGGRPYVLHQAPVFQPAPLNWDMRATRDRHLASHDAAPTPEGLPEHGRQEPVAQDWGRNTSPPANRFPPAPLNPNGTVAETPEVRAAKQKHLALLDEARAQALADCEDPDGAPSRTGVPRPRYSPPSQRIQPAPLNPDGTVAETPEVRQLKSRHLAVHAQARAEASQSKGDSWGFYSSNYDGNRDKW